MWNHTRIYYQENYSGNNINSQTQREDLHDQSLLDLIGIEKKYS